MLSLDRAHGSPEFDAPARAVRVRASAYESAALSRRTARWVAPTSSANSGVLASLTTLRDRSRQATRNDGYADGAIDVLVRSLIGTGIKPLSEAEDPAFRKAVQAAWLAWTDEADADGLLDWYGLQSQAVRGWLEGGEAFIRLRPRYLSDGLSVPLQIQVIEPELCPHTYDVLRLKSGHRVRAGIEFNAIGRRVAYYFHPSRPGDWQDYDASQLVRIPADAIVHLFNPLRAGQLRGLPHLTQALLKLRELDTFDDATVLRQQLANMFVGFITKPAAIGDTAVNPLTGEAVDRDPADRPLMGLEPGLFQELEPGEDVEFSTPPGAGETYAAFMKQQLRAVASATKVPYELLTGDMVGINDRTIRVILSEFRRRIAAWQHQVIVFQLCRRVWLAWLERAWFASVPWLPADFILDPAPWVRASFKPQRFDYIHPVQDLDAQEKAIRIGVTSRSAVVAEQGEDAEEIDRQQAEDNARADAMGLSYDSDSRHPEMRIGRSTETPVEPEPGGAVV